MMKNSSMHTAPNGKTPPRAIAKAGWVYHICSGTCLVYSVHKKSKTDENDLFDYNYMTLCCAVNNTRKVTDCNHILQFALYYILRHDIPLDAPGDLVDPHGNSVSFSSKPKVASDEHERHADEEPQEQQENECGHRHRGRRFFRPHLATEHIKQKKQTNR